MKKYIYIAANIILLLVLASCDDQLNQLPLSQATAENFYKTTNDFIQARNATYSYAFHGATEYGYANRILNLSETRSDNLYATTTASREWEGINNFYTSISSNSYITEAYVSNYNAIFKANQLLEKLDENGAVFTNPTDRSTMAAEAHFLRAFCYFDLVRWFGRVPLINRTMTAQEAALIGRTPVTDIYNLIISDLQTAITDLPPSYADADFGRATKYAAKGMLGLVYMTRSSPTYGIDGATLGLNEWNKAYQQLSDIKTSGLFTFGTTYAAIFTTEGNANKENVLVIPYTQNTVGTGIGGNFMTEVGYEPYFASIGLSAQGSLEGRPISTGFLSTFASNDARKTFGIATSYTVASGTYKGSYTYPVFKKYIDKTRYGASRTDWGVDFIVMRYTDVLMLMAECTLHGGGGTQADVDAIVNQVRTRAGVTANASNTTLDQLFIERRKEFFSEGTRWFDLIRSGNALTIMNAWKTAEDTEKKIRTIDKNSLLYPIPLQELLAAPGLYDQNPGYD